MRTRHLTDRAGVLGGLTLGLAITLEVAVVARQADAQPGPQGDPPPPPLPRLSPAPGGDLPPSAFVGGDPVSAPARSPEPPHTSPRPRPGMSVGELEKHLDRLDAERAELDQARKEPVAALRQKLQEQKKAVADLEKRLQDRGLVEKEAQETGAGTAVAPVLEVSVPVVTEPPKSR